MRRQASILITVMSFVLASTFAFGEARSPQLVISAFVEALKKNDMKYLGKYVDLDKVKKQKRHCYTLERLKTLFADVVVSKIECSKPIYDEKTKIIRVRMNKPLSFGFEMQHQNSVTGKGDFYRIIGTHP